MPLPGFMPRHDEDKLHTYMQRWAGAGKKFSVHNVWQGHKLNSPLEYTGNTAHQCSAVDSPKQSSSLCLSSVLSQSNSQLHKEQQHPRAIYSHVLGEEVIIIAGGSQQKCTWDKI